MRAGCPPITTRTLAWLAAWAGAVMVVAYAQLRQSPPPASSMHRSRSVNGSQILRIEIVRDYPHDATASTQGLIYLDGFLYERARKWAIPAS
jgi:glutamine cyclotransferase